MGLSHRDESSQLHMPPDQLEPAAPVKYTPALYTPQRVVVETGEAQLQGTLTLPAGATALVTFAHGGGSTRQRTRDHTIAQVLNESGLATLLFSLTTAGEDGAFPYGRDLRHDIERIAERLVGTTDWLLREPQTRDLRLGYFGARIGGGAAMVAAAARQDAVGAVISQGGRPDLAASALATVRAPTLLIVGAHDYPVIELNREALAQLQVERRLELVAGATHLFEEAGALERVAELARAWFLQQLRKE